MKLKDVRIKRFHSVADGELENCGNLNVLIGKNNSGKSNLLSAIHAFFVCLQDGNLVSLKPPIGQQIDFYQKEVKLPIELNLTFSMSLAERDALVRDIVTEAPQMKNAVDGIDPALLLSATMHIYPAPRQFAVINRITLVPASVDSIQGSSAKLTLLEVNYEAATELYNNLSNAAQQSADEQTIRQIWQEFGTDDWRMLKDREPSYIPKRQIFRRYIGSNGNPEILEIIESILRDSTSYDEFKRTLESSATKLYEEVSVISQALLTNKITTFAGEEAAVPKYVQNILTAVGELKVHKLSERRVPIGQPEAQQLLSLKVRRGGTAAFRNIQETVSALLGVQIDVFENDRPSSRGSNAEMDVDDFLAEANGAGIRESLRLVLDVEFERPNILLVEEPEVHLHPALETTMMRFLKQISDSCQVFITTHSTNFLDMANMKNVYLVSKDVSTQVQLINLEEAEIAIPRELGIRLSSLFMYDRLVFVEGPSDENIIREWSAILGVNLSQSNVGFVHMGGVRHLSYFATEATLSLLTKRQVQMWFLIDRDERDDDEIRRIEQRLKNKAIFHVLKKREIENYLICAPAITKLIQQKRPSVAAARVEDALELTEGNVENAIRECADTLKEVTIAKRVAREICKPIYPALQWTIDSDSETFTLDKLAEEGERMVNDLQQMINNAQAVYCHHSSDVDARWESLKISVVPGDLLLDKVFSRFGVRFHKNRDGARLAAVMSKTEIDEEIKGVIRDIAT